MPQAEVFCDPGVLVLVEAVDRHGRAVLRRGAAEPLELRHVTRPVELQLHVGVPRVLPDVVGLARVGPDEVVPVGVRPARLRVLGGGLGVAQRQAEPEGGAQLEVPGGAGRPGRLGLEPRVLGSVTVYVMSLPDPGTPDLN